VFGGDGGEGGDGFDEAGAIAFVAHHGIGRVAEDEGEGEVSERVEPDGAEGVDAEDVGLFGLFEGFDVLFEEFSGGAVAFDEGAVVDASGEGFESEASCAGEDVEDVAVIDEATGGESVEEAGLDAVGDGACDVLAVWGEDGSASMKSADDSHVVLPVLRIPLDCPNE